MCFKKQLFTITVLAILMLSSCTKNNGIDNNSVIVKPYVLYFSGDRGELFKTNTGRLFNLVFPPDGELLQPAMTICCLSKEMYISV